jgi:hypothetical protein
VSLLAGLASLSGAAYSAVRFVSPAARDGELRAVVRVGETDKRVAGATIEVLTPDDAVVATLTGDADGSARRTLPEGAYRLRATAPRFEPQTRAVEVHRDALAEVRFALAPHDERAAGGRRSSALANPVSRSVGAAQRFLQRLGL